ncbi:Uncharacterised protein [Mycobacterium tuberculosis]|nr:Uncharacterised protein [Mycobacterium tuberculosis]
MASWPTDPWVSTTSRPARSWASQDCNATNTRCVAEYTGPTPSWKDSNSQTTRSALMSLCANSTGNHATSNNPRPAASAAATAADNS